jgi:hypothetical protein
MNKMKTFANNYFDTTPKYKKNWIYKVNYLELNTIIRHHLTESSFSIHINRINDVIYDSLGN